MNSSADPEDTQKQQDIERIMQQAERAALFWFRLGRQHVAPGHQAAPGLQPMPPWHEAVRAALQAAEPGPRRVILQRLQEDGEPALALLAAAGAAGA